MNGLLFQLLKDYFDQEGFATQTLFWAHGKRVPHSHPQFLKVTRETPRDLSHEAAPYTPSAHDLQLFSKDLEGIPSAYVSVMTLPEASVIAGMLHSNAKMSEYFKKKILSLKADSQPLPSPANPSDGLQLLVVPGLPKQIPQRQEIFDYLRSIGIDGVLTTETVLESLVRKVDNYRQYDYSAVLQLLQLLKVYERLMPDQLELF